MYDKIHYKKKKKDHGIQLHISWQTKGEKVGAVTNFIFLGSKITADGDYRHEIKNTCSLEEKL